MNVFSFLAVGSAGISLALSVWLLISGLGNQGLQAQWQQKQQALLDQQQELATQQQKAQQQQQQIQSGKYVAEQVGPAVLKDLGSVVVQKKNEKIRGLLSRYGVSVQETPPAETKPNP
jgi:hypothetical protein